MTHAINTTNGSTIIAVADGENEAPTLTVKIRDGANMLTVEAEWRDGKRTTEHLTIRDLAATLFPRVRESA